MIDTHCHLNYPPLKDDIKGVLERAKTAGVDRFIVPGTGLASTITTIDISQENPSVWAGAGVHPTDVHVEDSGWVQVLDDLITKYRERIVMVGEIGLDYYHFEDCQTDAEKIVRKQVQKTAFLQQICLAKKHRLPICIHSREAFADTYEIIKNEANTLPVVIHCFSGTMEEARKWMELGCMLSFTGMVTYKKNNELRDVISSIPLEKIMVETDAPFLPPEGHRGEVCEPRYVVDVVQCIADCKKKEFQEVASITTRNAEQFFNISV